MHPVTLFAFKCFIYPLAVLYNVGFVIFLCVYALIHPGRKFWKIKQRDEPPKVLMNPEWGQHKFMQLKDIKLHYVENGDPNKELVVFLHGFPEFWYSWRYQLSDLSKDYWTVALDLRGYGESDKPQRMASYNMIKVIEDIRQFVKGLGREKFILVGHDWGGLLAWNFLDLHPDMVEKYVIINCPNHKTWIKTIATNFGQFISSWYCFFFQMPYFPEIGMTMNDFQKFNSIKNNKNPNSGISDEDIEVFKYMFSKKDAMKCAINYYRANCGQLNLIDASPNPYPKGLMLFGDKDEYLTLGFIESARKIVPHLQTCLIKGGNHFVQQDKPSETNRALRSFLTGKHEQIV